MSEISYRISLPQIDDAFILTNTCPFPGSGIGNSRNTTVELPGRITPRIIFRFLSCVSLDVLTYSYLIHCSLPPTYVQSNEIIVRQAVFFLYLPFMKLSSRSLRCFFAATDIQWPFCQQSFTFNRT